MPTVKFPHALLHGLEDAQVNFEWLATHWPTGGGTATLVAGTVVVGNTAVTANSRILLTPQDNNTTGALRVSARTPGTGFTITSSNAADTGVIAYQIFGPG